jgi:hypothetical protein
MELKTIIGLIEVFYALPWSFITLDLKELKPQELD